MANKTDATAVSGSPVAAGNVRVQFLFFVAVLFLNIIEGIDGQLLAVALPAIGEQWAAPATDFRLAMAIGFAGAAVGTPIGGLLGDWIGRRTTILAGAVVFTLGTLALSFCETPTHLVLARAVAGLGLGACFPPTLALLAECMPARRRGMAFALALLCHPLGIALAGVLSAVVIPEFGWRALFMFAAAASMLALFAVSLFVPESPMWLARFERHKERAAQLRLQFGLPEESTSSAQGREQAKASIASILAPGRRLAVLGLFGAFFSVYLLLSAVLSWMPSFMSGRGFSIAVAGMSVTVWSVSGVVGTFLSGTLISRIGTAWTSNLMMCCALAGVLLLSLTGGLVVEASGIKMAMFYTLIAVSGFGVSGSITSLFTHASEAFPAEIRSSGVGFSTMAGKIGGITGAFGGAATVGFDSLTLFFAVAALPVVICIALFNSRYLAGRLDLSRA